MHWNEYLIFFRCLECSHNLKVWVKICVVAVFLVCLFLTQILGTWHRCLLLTVMLYFSIRPPGLLGHRQTCPFSATTFLTIAALSTFMFPFPPLAPNRLERLVDVLRKKVGAGPVRTVIWLRAAVWEAVTSGDQADSFNAV